MILFVTLGEINMKKKRRLVSIVCAAVLALSGPGVLGAGDFTLTAHAEEEDPYEIGFSDYTIGIANEFGEIIDEDTICDGEGPTYSAVFMDEELENTVSDPEYEWTLSKDIQKYLYIDGSATGDTIAIATKEDALRQLGGEVCAYGELTLTVYSDDLEEPLVREISINFALDAEFYIADACRVSTEFPTRTVKMEVSDNIDPDMISWDLSGDYADDIFSVSKTGKDITVKLMDDAANIVAENGLDNDDCGYPLYAADMEFYLESKTGKTMMNLRTMTLEFYLEDLYEVTYSPEELYFVRGVAAEKTITANIKNAGSKNITYKWSLDGYDPESEKCFKITQTNSKTVKVKYNGYASEDDWFALLLDIEVNGKPKPLSKDTGINLSDTEEKPNNNEEESGSGNNGESGSGNGKESGSGNSGESGSANGGKQENPPTVQQNENQNNDQAKKPKDIGTLIEVAGMNNYKFVVTSNTEGAATVAFAGLKNNKKDKKLTIPATITDENGIMYTVTSISAKALNANKKITKVVIPETVTLIGKKAFYQCSKLGTIIIKSENLTIRDKAFGKIKKGATITIYASKKLKFNRMVKKIKKAGAKSAEFKYEKIIECYK